jgi:hypothetical protein
MYHIDAIRDTIASSSGSTTSSLKSIFQNLGNRNDDARGRRVSTLNLTTTLNLDPRIQMDAQEFVKLLIRTPEFKGSTSAGDGVFETTASPLSFWKGSIQEYLISPSTPPSFPSKIRETNFYDLSLPVGGGGGSVKQALELNYGVESSELMSPRTGNGYRPTPTKAKTKTIIPKGVDALKGERLISSGLPSILTLHLKRFKIDWTQGDEGQGVKLYDKVEFGRRLDLGDLVERGDDVKAPGSVYRLQSVVIHKGGFEGGHYYSYVNLGIGKKSKDGGDDWWRFDDEIVEPVEWRIVEEDSFGGKGLGTNPPSNDEAWQTCVKKTKDQKDKPNCVQRLLNKVTGKTTTNDDSYGGTTACAYLLQYVKESDVERLYTNNVKK